MLVWGWVGFWRCLLWLGSLWLESVCEPGRPLSRNLVSQMLAEVIVRGVLTPYCQKFWNPQDPRGVDVEDRNWKTWWNAKNSTGMGILHIFSEPGFFSSRWMLTHRLLLGIIVLFTSETVRISYIYKYCNKRPRRFSKKAFQRLIIIQNVLSLLC